MHSQGRNIDIGQKLKHKVSHLYVIDHLCECHGDIYSPFDLTLVTGMHPYVSLY